MDHNDSGGLLKSFLGFLSRTPPEKRGSLGSRRRKVWVTSDAQVHLGTNDIEEIEPELLESALTKMEDIVDLDSDSEPISNLNHAVPYPKLQAVRRITQRSSHDPDSEVGSSIRISKRKRKIDAVIEELSRLDQEAKRRRVLPREEQTAGDDVDESDADFAISMRKRSLTLHHGLQTHWTCVCRKCSGLSVRLLLPQRQQGSQIETCFEIFFGVRSVLAITFQEAKITVKDVQNEKAVSTSEFAHICQCITESLDQRNCLHLLFQDGLFKRLRPQPKTFGDSQTPRTVSLSVLFKRQQELRGGASVIPLKGKRILAVTLATALLPFLETPWVQPTFNHSNIQFFQPLQNGELPNITKPFLLMEQVPIISGNRTGAQNGQAKSASSKHLVHPNASVLALGILLCELHYCTTVESWRSDTEPAQNVNADYYTSLEILKNLEADAGTDYYLATKACLQWEYFPAGEMTSFDSASVQRLFYQNVIKRLESEIFKMWRLRLEDLNSLDSQENEHCWGLIGREVVSQPRRDRFEDSTRSRNASAASLNLVSDMKPLNYALQESNTILPTSNQQAQNSQDCSQKGPLTKSLYLFDASHHTGSQLNTRLSERWMDNLLSSIYHHVDPLDFAMRPSTGRIEDGFTPFEPVRIAILDSGFDPKNPLLINDIGQLDPRIKEVRNFVHNTEPWDIQDEIGHGTHALGLLLKVATCAEIYVARVANQMTLGRGSYDDIAKAINHAVTEWNADIISMSFGIREYHEPMKTAISNALHNQTLMFAAASNDGGNLGRAFPAKYPSVFCIHSTDGNGNPSAFNPTADDKDVNFSLLGEDVSSHWPAGVHGHQAPVNVMSGTSVATPIAAGLAGSILSFVCQQEQGMAVGSDLLGPWLKDVHSMDAILKSMVRGRRGAGYDYITPRILLDTNSSREQVYDKIKDLKKHMYD